MTENKMFCFQCQETAKGTGCTIQGVCGKTADTSMWQDLLLSVVRGIGTVDHCLKKAGKEKVLSRMRFSRPLRMQTSTMMLSFVRLRMALY